MIPSFERTVHIECPIHQGFNAWADASTFGRWFAPMAETQPDVEIDFRVGGRYEIRMTLGPDQVHLTRGEYREIEHDDKIVFSWHCDAFADEPTLVTVSFEADQRGTLVTVLHERFQSQEAAGGQTMGWNACMDSLKAYLQQQANDQTETTENRGGLA